MRAKATYGWLFLRVTRDSTWILRGLVKSSGITAVRDVFVVAVFVLVVLFVLL